jgi:hypothetical protein
MGKDFIGKRVRLTIGNTPPPKDENAITGSDTDIHITPEEAAKYDNITGEKVEVRIGGDPDLIVREIIDTIGSSNEDKKDEIIAICNAILSEHDNQSKTSKIGTMISLGSGISSISQFCLQLKTMFGI